MPNHPPRLGDVIDDYCPKCRLLLNHDVAAMLGENIAQVTCRTCYNTHDYRHAEVPTRRQARKAKEKQNLMDQVLSGMPPPPSAPPSAVPKQKKRDLWAEVERLKQKK